MQQIGHAKKEKNMKYRKIKTLVASLLAAYTGYYSTYAGEKAPVEHFTRAAAHEDILTAPQVAKKQFDFIVVGAGVAGSVLAARLSEDSSKQVLLIEAGGENPYDIGRSQGAFFLTWGSDKNWAYQTTPQVALGERVIDQPRGRAVGGSSTINVGAWLRGRPEDYDAWERAGAKGWNAKSALEAYLNVEATERGPSDVRGNNGPILMSDIPTPTQLSDRLLDAYVEAGLGAKGDSNGKYPFVADRYQTLFVKGVRQSIADAFLTSKVRSRNNFTLLTNSHVTRVIVEKARVIGVEVSTKEGKYIIKATAEVVLSCGVFNTPQILMLSGIGPRKHLEELGIPVVADIPAVGDNLQDHICAHVYTLAERGVKGSVPPNLSDTAVQEWLTTHGGSVSYFAENGVAWASLDGNKVPDFELLLSYNTANAKFANLPDASGRSGVTIGVVLLQPRSSGTVRLASTDPFAKPIIDPQYLSNSEDVKTLKQGLRIAHKLVSTPGLKPWAEAIFPAPTASDGELEKHIRNDVATVYHAIGTARMGSVDDPNTVVDPALRVKGIKGLRVADASVMPKLIRGHTMAPSVYIGYRAADLILKGSDF